MNNLIIDDTASRFQVPPKTTLFYPDKKDKLYQISVIEDHLGKLKLDMTSGGRTLMRWCAPNQYGPTRNLRLYCLK